MNFVQRNFAPIPVCLNTVWSGPTLCLSSSGARAQIMWNEHSILMRNFVLLLVFWTTVTRAISAATSTAVKTARKKTGSSYGSYSSSSYTSSLLNSSYERAVSPFDFDGELVVVYLTIPSVVLFSLVSRREGRERDTATGWTRFAPNNSIFQLINVQQ